MEPGNLKLVYKTEKEIKKLLQKIFICKTNTISFKFNYTKGGLEI